jgi:hypothetical protein
LEEGNFGDDFSLLFCYDLQIMVPLAIGWSSLILLAAILVLAVRGGFLIKYKAFYSFVAALLVIGLLRFYFFALDRHPDYYFAYWYTQFLIVSGSCGVLWQVYRIILDPYKGAAKLGRALVDSVFVGVWLYCLIKLIGFRTEELRTSLLQIEQEVQAFQSVLLMILLLLIWYYSIPLGRNLTGMLIGQGVFIETRILILYFQSVLGTSFNVWRNYMEPLSFLATITIWLVALRSYSPIRLPAHELGLERDYELLLKNTSQVVSRTRTYLTKVLEP